MALLKRKLSSDSEDELETEKRMKFNDEITQDGICLLDDLETIRQKFTGDGLAGEEDDNLSAYNEKAKKLMKSMGYVEGTGLGKKSQGRVDPVEASMQKGRRGLGHIVSGFENSGVLWNFEKEQVSLVEDTEWLPSCTLPVPDIEILQTWVTEAEKKATIDDESTFCTPRILENVLKSKSVFDTLEEEQMRKARTRSNPYETIRGCFFQNRAAMKMANMDAVLNFMFTKPTDRQGKPLLQDDDLLYFADICAGPGGFSEYVLWRRGWPAKGFGFTLRGPCDFKLEEFYAASAEQFEPHYGVKGLDGDGDIYRPDNLREFTKFVLDNTEGLGVHFVMADGGFSVEGQENIQEVLSKRLYLCQFLCALMILREGGQFVCKLFDVFTPFSVGLIYLMYRSFDRVSIIKPVTSRPANSERYIVCSHKRADSAAVQQYMFELNERMCEIWPGNSQSNLDIQHVVPLKLLCDDSPFYDYIRNSNDKLGFQQVVSLLKIETFARNLALHDARQVDVRRQCLDLWKIPDEVRTAPNRTEKPETRLMSLSKEAGLDLVLCETAVTAENLAEKIHSVYDYRCFVVGAETHNYLFSLGGCHVYKKDANAAADKWRKCEDVRVELPANTLLLVQLVHEFRGEGKGQRKVMVVYVMDALFLSGVDIRDKHFNDRIAKVKQFLRVVTRRTRSDLVPLRVVEPFRLEHVQQLLNNLEMKMQKSGGQQPRLSYMFRTDSREQQTPYFSPAALCLIKIVAEPWMMAVSKSAKKKYYFNTKTKLSCFDTPPDACASYQQSSKCRLVWKWETSGHQLVDQQSGHVTVNSQSLIQQKLLDFIREKL